MNFSDRTNWQRQPNEVSLLLSKLLKSGKTVLDLTVTNPTACNICYNAEEILSALASRDALKYQPDPRGLLSAREEISKYYKGREIYIDPLNIFLTASTSEAYSLIFKLLCNSGENVVVPEPSYPLFDYLVQLNDIKISHYKLRYDRKWQIDTNSIKNAITSHTKAVIFINPHNPTGMFLKKTDYFEIIKIAEENDIAIIVDEVFIDYAFEEDDSRISAAVNEKNLLTFTLNGISKTAGLPQLKLGWLIVGGKKSLVNEAMGRLEIISDTFLSVNTPVQVALPQLLISGGKIREMIDTRIKNNYNFLRRILKPKTVITTLNCEGGWYGIIRVPEFKSDEEWAKLLLGEMGIYLYPGYFFDFEESFYLVVSLLTEELVFQKAIRDMIEYISEESAVV